MHITHIYVYIERTHQEIREYKNTNAHSRDLYVYIIEISNK